MDAFKRYGCYPCRTERTEKETGERELKYEFFVKNGASGLSFDTIVGAGKNSAQIHSTPTEYVIKEQDIIEVYELVEIKR